ncbi:hypothetical protein [Planosporangium mesophilum]|uniref:Uncharacterized protein n=1 Tax=Planosporangium mesophilum TaxID=689768 RepID=A0A8J3T5E2_9ACTN|nr:hypothetical protein [Planosporangium mesophilum]NJC81498.1 hypothetical protein [Planosporangium mesophilum]GII20845.1 hypothetical protein Pme01_04420 [Planosporangium mesophilum]
MDPHVTAASLPVLALLAVTLGYAVGCWIWPFRACRRCAGTGKRRSPSGRGIRLCRRCRGTGLRLRAGRWIYNQLTRLRKDGTR